MPLRRLLSLLSLGAFVAAVWAACLPWSVATPRLRSAVARELASAYGLAMTAEGATEITLLPLPRLGFRAVRLNAGSRDGPILAEGGALSLQLSLIALLTGRIDVNALGLDGATLHLPSGEDDTRWAEPVRLLNARLGADGASHPRRITLSRATATGLDPRDGSPQTARDLDLTLSWPLWSAQAEIFGSFQWSAMPTRFAVSGLRVADLLDGGTTPFSLSASWSGGTLTAEGSGLVRAEGLTLTGLGQFDTRSLPETLAWAGGSVALSPFVGPFGMTGNFEMNGRQLLLPNVRVAFGDNRLEGAGAVSFGQDRPAVQATLAAETLNLAPMLADVLKSFGVTPAPAGAPDWRTRDIALAPYTGGDLDLRISAGVVRFGPILAEDLAASVLVRDGNIEASLNRAALGGGTLKGRLALASSARDASVTEAKVQGAFDRLDLAVLPAELRPETWVLGGAQGQFQAEGTGADLHGFLRHLDGHAVMTVDGGTLLGIDLAEAALRSRMPAPRVGRTPFERATLSLRFRDGIGEITEGAMEGTILAASLRGTVSLPDRRCDTLAEVVARGSASDRRFPMRFLIAGPFDGLDVRSLAPDAAPDLRGGWVTPANPSRLPAAGLALPAGVRAYAP
ncbi:AsmA family protein [Methylobacterium sp. M6A4_1b]